jgi:hypothetical protein
VNLHKDESSVLIRGFRMEESFEDTVDSTALSWLIRYPDLFDIFSKTLLAPAKSNVDTPRRCEDIYGCSSQVRGPKWMLLAGARTKMDTPRRCED